MAKKRKTDATRKLKVAIVPDREATIRHTVNAVLQDETGLGPDYTKVMGTYYGLTGDKIGGFLQSVADELPAPYQFDPGKIATGDAATSTLGNLVGLISQYTIP
ncbi:MAG TPA: hypothetical protein VGM17_16835 [Rhizomicrobium sp.]